MYHVDLYSSLYAHFGPWSKIRFRWFEYEPIIKNEEPIFSHLCVRFELNIKRKKNENKYIKQLTEISNGLYLNIYQNAYYIAHIYLIGTKSYSFLCMQDKFVCFSPFVDFELFFQEYNQSVKQLISICGPLNCFHCSAKVRESSIANYSTVSCI